jgi:hypothetical protein
VGTGRCGVDKVDILVIFFWARALKMHGNYMVKLVDHSFPFFIQGTEILSLIFFLFGFYIRNFEKIKKHAKSNLAIITIGISFSHRLSQLLTSK